MPNNHLVQLTTRVPRIPHPGRYLKRPVRIGATVVGRVTAVEFDTKSPEHLVATCVVTGEAAGLIARGAVPRIDGLPASRSRG